MTLDTPHYCGFQTKLQGRETKTQEVNLHSGGNELEPPELQDREGWREDHCIGLFSGFSVAGVKLAMMNFGKGAGSGLQYS